MRHSIVVDMVGFPEPAHFIAFNSPSVRVFLGSKWTILPNRSLKQKGLKFGLSSLWQVRQVLNPGSLTISSSRGPSRLDSRRDAP